MSSDMSEDSSDWSSAEELEDWNQDLSDVLCLFCQNTFSSIDESFGHLKSVHKLDLIDICIHNKIDSIEYIKLINYIRVNKCECSQIKQIIESKDYESEQFMKPFIKDDRFLTYDIESNFCHQNDGNRSDGNPNYRQLSEQQLIDLLQESDIKIKELEIQLSMVKQLINNQMPESISTEDKSTVGQLSMSEDQYYTSSYSHYSIHYEMLSDKIRTKSYEDSILKNKHFFENKTVLDIGCGTGILSLFAAKAGAQLVVAVDQSDIIYKAMEFAIENKLDSKIKFIKTKLESIDFESHDLPLKYDIIISEWMGYFLLFEGMLDSILYARNHFLKDSGILVPNQSSLSIAGICDPDLHFRVINFWDNVYGFKMSSMKNEILSEALIESVSKDVINTSLFVIKTFDLMTCNLDETHCFETDFQLVCSSDKPIVGIVGWFDCGFDVKQLTHKVILSTAPFNESTHWKQTVFVLKKPIDSKVGDRIDGSIKVYRNVRDIRSLVIQIHLKGREKQTFHLS